MGNGYAVQPTDALDQLRMILQNARQRLRELEALDGSQIYNTVQDLRNLIDGLLNQVNGNFTGTLTVGGLSSLDEIDSLATYSRNVTGSGSYRSVQVNLNGQIGYVPSSRQFKRDIADLPDSDSVLNVQVVRFRYKDAVENMGDGAPVEVGVIAEQVHKLGLTWLVDYDENGKPFGVKYERLALALLPILQDHSARLKAAGL